MIPAPGPAPEPHDLAVQRAERAWNRLGLRLRSITPSMAVRALMIAAAAYVLFRLVAGAWSDLLPFQLGIALAYITLPLVNWLDRWMPRQVAALVVVLLELVGLVAAVGLLVPPIATEATELVLGLPTPDELRARLAEVRANMEELPPPTQAFLRDGMDQVTERLRGQLLETLQGAIALAIAGVLGVLNTLGFIIALIGIPTWLIAILTDQRMGVRAINRFLPAPVQPDFWAVLRILDRTFSTYIRGQLYLAVFVGAGVFGGLWLLEQLGIVRVPYRLVLALIATVMQLIPTIGPILGAVPGLMVGLASSRDVTLAILAVYVGVQVLQSMFIAPRIVSRSIDIHAALLVIMLVLLSQFGFIWVLLAAPLAVAVRDLYRYAYGRVSDPPRPAGLLPGELPPLQRPNQPYRLR